MVGITFGIYQIGYRNGVVDYIENPEEQQQALITGVLSMANATSTLDGTDENVKRTVFITEKVLKAAIEMAEKDLDELKIENSKTLNINVSPNELKEKIAESEMILRRLRGNWKVYVTNSDDVNAFVTDIFPKSLFINNGLFKTISPTEDELAMIIAHEISHVIHDHNKSASLTQAVIYGIQLVLFSLVDPTGGVSFLFDVAVSHAVQVLFATHSRSNEEEADITGLQIMSQACFDGGKGSAVFNKLAALNKNHKASWTDSHPSSATRAEYIVQASEIFNKPTDCQSIRNDYILAQEYRNKNRHAN